MICGYCHRRIADEIEMSLHDIQLHNGLARMRATHEFLCTATECDCRLAEYEMIDRELRAVQEHCHAQDHPRH